MSEPELKNCFVIAPIGEPDSETRKRSDLVLKHVIRPAVQSCGYKAIRADEIDKPGIITSQVIQHVVNDPLVVADLTERNPNVFYELAIRHALKNPFVQIIKKGERIPFDVAGTRTVYIDHRDLDSVEAAKNEIISQVKMLEKDTSELETPISVSLDLQLLRQSEKPEERSLADLVAAMSELRNGVSKLEAKIGTSDGEGALDEIQNAVRSLTRRFDDRFEASSFIFRRSKRFHPMMFQELMHMSRRSSSAVGLLIVASMFRDTIPWLYEIGLDAYRELKKGYSQKAIQAIDEFKEMAELMMHGPWGREIFGRTKEMMYMLEELEPILDRITKMIEEESPHMRRRIIKNGNSSDDDI